MGKVNNIIYYHFSQCGSGGVVASTICEGMRMKENSERLEWLQIHVDLQSEEKTLQEKITFNSLTNSVGPRRFLHCGVLKKTKSEKDLLTVAVENVGFYLDLS